MTLLESSYRRDAKLRFHYGDLANASSCMRIVAMVRPTEIYNLGAQSHVGMSFGVSEYTANIDALGTLRLLNAILQAGFERSTRFFQARHFNEERPLVSNHAPRPWH